MRTLICLTFSIFYAIVLVMPALGQNQTKEIVFGGTASMQGQYSEPSQMIQTAYRFWTRETNRKGGLLNRKIRLVLYDDKSDANLVKRYYKKLIEQDKVDVLLSPYSTPLTLVASEISEKHQMLMLAVAAAAEKPWQKGARYLFQLYAPAKRQFIGLVDLMAKKNYRTLALIYNEASDFNLEIAMGIREWAELYKVKVVFDKGYRNGKKELPGILREIKSKNVDGLINSAYPLDSYELMRLLKEMKFKPPILGMPIIPAHPLFRAKVGKIANGIFGPSQWEPIERIPFPGTKAFIKEFTQFSKFKPSFHAASAYASCQLIEEAISKTQSLDQRKLRDYIDSLNTVTVLGRFKVDPSGKQVGHNSFIIQWQNDKKEIVWPHKMETSKPQF